MQSSHYSRCKLNWSLTSTKRWRPSTKSRRATRKATRRCTLSTNRSMVFPRNRTRTTGKPLAIKRSKLKEMRRTLSRFWIRSSQICRRVCIRPNSCPRISIVQTRTFSRCPTKLSSTRK
uniref:(northern house mosquito) hypothetical protein n=1 Tax=Culex pipiens TaxID=7175 RepID=A0A8D8FMV4_CULPI